MKKRWTACLCVLLALVMLGGCTMPWQKKQEQATVLRVSGAEVSQDLYAYYLTLVLRNPQDYDLAEDAKDRELMEKAESLCVQYVAVNSAFADAGLHLSPAYKTQIAENVSTKWSFYQNFYRAVGISKQTVTSYETNEAKRKTWMAYKYGVDGTNPVSEIALNANYAVNYVTFQSINGYLTKVGADGSTQRLSAEEITAAENRFKAMCEQVRTGSDLETVCKENENDPYVASSEVETITINRKTSNYPQDFFLSVQKMDIGAPRVIETSDYIFLVVRQSDKSDSSYEAHRQACLQEICAEPFENDLKTITDGYAINEDSSVMKSVFATVRDKFE